MAKQRRNFKKSTIGHVKSPSGVNPRMVNFLDMLEETELNSARTTFLNFFTSSKSWRSEFRARWLEYYQLYRSYSRYYENNPDWQSSYFVPKTFEFIETVLPRLTGAVYDFSPLWIALPKEPKFRKAANSAEMLLDTRVTQTRLYMEHYQSFKEMLIYGTGIQKLTYEVTPDYEGTRWRAIDLFDFFPDPVRADILQMRGCVHREVEHIDELKLLEEQGVYQDVDKVGKESGTDLFSHLDRMRLIGIDGHSSDISTKDYHEVLEYWGKWRDKKTEVVFDVVATIADRKHLIRFEQNPYVIRVSGEDYFYAIKPFVAFRDVVVPHEFYGIGEVEVARSTQYEINDRRNAINDAIQFALAPTYQIQKGGVRDLDDVVFAPGAIIETLLPEPLRVVQKDLGFLHAYNDMTYLKGEMQDALGVQDPLRGAAAAKRLTATESVSLVQEGNQRIKQKGQIIEIGPMADQARMTYQMEKQFTREEIYARMMGSERAEAFLKINPSKLEFEGDFRLQVSSLFGQKSIMAQQRLQLLEVIGGMLKVAPELKENVDFLSLLRSIAHAMDIKETDIIVDVKQPEPPKAGLSLVQGGTGQAGTAARTPSLPTSPEELAALGVPGAAAGGAMEGGAPPELQNLASQLASIIQRGGLTA